MLATLSPARRRFVVVLVALVVTVIVVVTVWAARRATTSAVQPVPQDRPGPVLLVPGYGGSVLSLAPLVSALRAEGRDATIVTLAGDGTGDLRVQAQRLGQAAQAAMDRTGAMSVDVIGYSAGGVVARLRVRDYGGDEAARRVLTLGSPHHGTTVAALAAQVVPGLCTGACEQLAPDSDLLRALNAGDETPEGPRFVSIWTTADELVTPAGSASLEGAINITVQGICPDSQVAHRGLPSDPVVLGSVLLALGRTLPVAPTAEDCGRLSS